MIIEESRLERRVIRRGKAERRRRVRTTQRLLSKSWQCIPKGVYLVPGSGSDTWQKTLTSKESKAQLDYKGEESVYYWRSGRENHGSPRIYTTSEQGLEPLGSREEYTLLLKSKPEKGTFPCWRGGWASVDRILTLINLKDGIAYEWAIPLRKEFTCKGPKEVSKAGVLNESFFQAFTFSLQTQSKSPQTEQQCSCKGITQV